MSERHDEILDFMRHYQREHGLPPSTRMIQRQFGFASQTSVVRVLHALARRGAIERLADKAWGVKAREVQAHLFELPIFGVIPAGGPSLQEQEPTRRLPCDPAALFPGLAHPERLWGLEVHGDSMIDAHIVDGDIAILEQREAHPGDIVAALVDETTTTLKRLLRQAGRLILHPENPRYPDIIPERSLAVQGVLVGLIGRGKR